MKRSLVVLTITTIVATSFGLSQTQQGAWEFSVSGGFASYFVKTESSGHTSESASENLFSLLLRPGYFVIEGLEIEPELFWGAATGEPPSFSFSGNLSYNYLVPGSRVALFALAGYGVGNGVPVLERMVGRSSDSFDITLLNLGAGTKIFVTKAVAFRAEYRYQMYKHDASGGSTSTTTTTLNFHNAYLGISVFLP
jgi:opacity protein-like surface antigen